MNSTTIPANKDAVIAACNRCIAFVWNYRNEKRKAALDELMRPRFLRRPRTLEEAEKKLFENLHGSTFYLPDYECAYAETLGRALTLCRAMESCVGDTANLSVEDAELVTRYQETKPKETT